VFILLNSVLILGCLENPPSSTTIPRYDVRVFRCPGIDFTLGRICSFSMVVGGHLVATQSARFFLPPPPKGGVKGTQKALLPGHGHQRNIVIIILPLPSHGQSSPRTTPPPTWAGGRVPDARRLVLVVRALRHGPHLHGGGACVTFSSYFFILCFEDCFLSSQSTELFLHNQTFWSFKDIGSDSIIPFYCPEPVGGPGFFLRLVRAGGGVGGSGRTPVRL